MEPKNLSIAPTGPQKLSVYHFLLILFSKYSSLWLPVKSRACPSWVGVRIVTRKIPAVLRTVIWSQIRMKVVYARVVETSHVLRCSNLELGFPYFCFASGNNFFTIIKKKYWKTLVQVLRKGNAKCVIFATLVYAIVQNCNCNALSGQSSFPNMSNIKIQSRSSVVLASVFDVPKTSRFNYHFKKMIRKSAGNN